MHIASILGDRGTVLAFNVEQRLLPILNEKIITLGVNSNSPAIILLLYCLTCTAVVSILCIGKLVYSIGHVYGITWRLVCVWGDRWHDKIYTFGW